MAVQMIDALRAHPIPSKGFSSTGSHSEFLCIAFDVCTFFFFDILIAKDLPWYESHSKAPEEIDKYHLARPFEAQMNAPYALQLERCGVQAPSSFRQRRPSLPACRNKIYCTSIPATLMLLGSPRRPKMRLPGEA
jgi:hypothetical protein